MIQQTAVNFRYDDEPTTVRFARDSNRMLQDIWKVKTNAWRGQYDVATSTFSFPAADQTAAHGLPVSSPAPELANAS